LARRGGEPLKQYDPLDLELFVFIEQLINKQQYLSARASIPGANTEKLTEALWNAYHPYTSVETEKQADKMAQTVESMQQNTYTIRRGVGGNSLEVKKKQQ
jgi:hypothetical protein